MEYLEPTKHEFFSDRFGKCELCGGPSDDPIHYHKGSNPLDHKYKLPRQTEAVITKYGVTETSSCLSIDCETCGEPWHKHQIKL